MPDRFLKKAFRVLRRNYGCPGPDGLSLKDIKGSCGVFERQISREIREEQYIFEQPLERTITDYMGNLRTIFVYNVTDRWVQQALRLAIADRIYRVLMPNVFGFRPKHDHNDAIRHVLSFNPKRLVHLDIKNFFGSIDRSMLMKALTELGTPANCLSLIDASIGHVAAGLPQGNCLSPLLSTFYLSLVDKRFPFGYARFCDDLFFALDSISIGDCERLISTVETILKDIDLELNLNKIRVVDDPNNLWPQ